MEKHMAEPLVLNFAGLHDQHKQEILDYETNFKGELRKIADIVNPFLDNTEYKKLNPDIITDRNKWTFQHVIPTSERSGKDVALDVPGKEVIHKKNALRIEGNESLFKFLNDKIDQAKKNKSLPKDIKIQLNHLKDYVGLLQIQAMSKIAEIGSLDSLQNLKECMPQLADNIINGKNPIQNREARRLYQSIERSIEELQTLYKQYSLDFMSGNIERYTSNEAGKLRKSVKEYTKSIGKILDYYEKSGYLSKAEKEEMRAHLKSSQAFFEHKNNISFSVPTAGQTNTQTVRKVGQAALGLGGVVLGATAAGVGIIATGPVGATAATVIGGGAMLAGISSLGITAVNSANNFIRFGITPSSGEKLTFAIAGVSLGVGIGAGLGSTLVSGNQLATRAIMGGQQAFDSSKSALAIAGSTKTIKSLRTSDEQVNTFDKKSPQASLKQNLQAAQQGTQPADQQQSQDQVSNAPKSPKLGS